MKHEFNYTKRGPFITLGVRDKNNKKRLISFLVDSGADYSIISKSRALILGIDLNTSLYNRELQFANGEIEIAGKFFINICFGDEEINTPVFVVENEGDCLLGRAGIFDYFDVCFKQKLQKVIFTRS